MKVVKDCFFSNISSEENKKHDFHMKPVKYRKGTV